MARSLSGRIRVSGILEAIDPIHVGCGRDSVETDMALATDGLGRLYVPGTSLAGPLRHWCQRAFEGRATGGSSAPQAEDPTRTLWGFQDGADGHAAWVFVEDGAVIGPDGQRIQADPADLTEVRDGVGIDRQWGAAAHHIKFDRAVLQKGTRIAFDMTVDLPDERIYPGGIERSKAMLGHLLQALQAGEIRLGAAKTRGLGRVQLIGRASERDSSPSKRSTHQSAPADIWHEDLTTRKGLIDRMNDNRAGRIAPQDLIAAAPQMSFQPTPRVQIAIHWKAVGPVMVKAGIDGLRVDSVPLLGGMSNSLQAPLIPGSSLKGVLRAHAERILRTVMKCDSPAWTNEVEGKTRFLNQLDEDLPLVQTLFGARSRKASRRGRGALAVADCFAESPQPTARWKGLFFEPSADDDAEVAAFDAALAQVGRTKWQKAFHVAIDRWTGGAAENLLYQVLEPFGERWPAFELVFDLGLLSDSRRDRSEHSPAAAWTLLLLTLRDMAQGRIPIGFGVNRGLGEVAVEKIVITPNHAESLGLTHQVELRPTEPSGQTGWLGNFGSDLLRQWTDAWKSELTRNGKVAAHA
jgi:CRISPR/Cas system CSM-associated protein Csm3 (group 7 of RAMP superfamily)